MIVAAPMAKLSSGMSERRARYHVCLRRMTVASRLIFIIHLRALIAPWLYDRYRRSAGDVDEPGRDQSPALKQKRGIVAPRAHPHQWQMPRSFLARSRPPITGADVSSIMYRRGIEERLVGRLRQQQAKPR